MEAVTLTMDAEVLAKISKEWNIPEEEALEYASYFAGTVRPVIKTNYLSHLVTAVENMVNENRMRKLFENLAMAEHKDKYGQFRALLGTKTFRLFSIVLVPANIKRRATTRHHNSGAIIYYCSSYDEKIIRILIAHEIGHIVNRELFKKSDTERAANLFTYIAMHDKNKFYSEECERFVSKSDVQIFNDIANICPV